MIKALLFCITFAPVWLSPTGDDLSELALGNLKSQHVVNIVRGLDDIHPTPYWGTPSHEESSALNFLFENVFRLDQDLNVTRNRCFEISLFDFEVTVAHMLPRITANNQVSGFVETAKIIRGIIGEKRNFHERVGFERWGLSAVFDAAPKPKVSVSGVIIDLNFDSRQVCPNLRLTDFSGGIYSLQGSTVRLSRKAQSPNQKSSSEKDKKSGNPSSIFHTMGGFIHGLRSSVHALLGGKVVLLTLSGFGFAALAGLGGFTVFDDPNRDRKRIILGWLALVAGPIFGALCLLLGLQ